VKRELPWQSYWGTAPLSAVEAIEAELGRRFPSAYREIVTRFNGASLERGDAFRFFCEHTGREEIYGLGLLHAFWPSGASGGDATDVEQVEVTETMRWRLDHSDLPDGLVSFSADGAGNLLCFDYRGSPESSDPPIVLWHNPVQTPFMLSNNPVPFTYLAPSFETFLAMLFDEEEAGGGDAR